MLEWLLMFAGAIALIVVPLKMSMNSRMKEVDTIKKNTGAEKVLRITMENYHALTILGFEDTIRVEYDGLVSQNMKVEDITVSVMSKEDIKQKFSLGKATVGTVVFGATGGAIMGNNGKTIKENHEVILLTVKDKYNNDRSVEINMINYDRLMSFLMEYKN